MVVGEVAVDEDPCLLAAYVELAGEAEGAHAVDDAEVDGLGHPPHLLGDERRVDPEDLGRGLAVDVLAGAEGSDERRVPGVMGQYPEVDLRIVGREEKLARRGDEGRAQPLAFGGADRDVLEVRVAAGEASRRRYGLIVGRVDPSRPGMNHLRQGVDVGRFELGHAPVCENLRG